MSGAGRLMKEEKILLQHDQYPKATDREPEVEAEAGARAYDHTALSKRQVLLNVGRGPCSQHLSCQYKAKLVLPLCGLYSVCSLISVRALNTLTE